MEVPQNRNKAEVLSSIFACDRSGWQNAKTEDVIGCATRQHLFACSESWTRTNDCTKQMEMNFPFAVPTRSHTKCVDARKADTRRKPQNLADGAGSCGILRLFSSFWNLHCAEKNVPTTYIHQNRHKKDQSGCNFSLFWKIPNHLLVAQSSVHTVQEGTALKSSGPLSHTRTQTGFLCEWRNSLFTKAQDGSFSKWFLNTHTFTQRRCWTSQMWFSDFLNLFFFPNKKE